MHDLCLLTVIVRRDEDELFTSFFRDRGIETVHSVLCQGTASAKLLSLMGLERTEKTLLYAMVPRGRASRLMNGMVRELGLNMPGSGIAFTLPVGSLAGASSLRYLTEGQEIIIGGDTDMPATFLYELIFAIVNRGHVDEVMDAACEAGARGGTVIHAKGTNPFREKFFGVSIADEKEMVLILSAAVEKTKIMRTIMEQAGVQSPAHTIMFSVPVESVAGLKSVMEAAGEGEL